MWIKMIRTAKGADDGIHVKPYSRGEVYNVGASLGKAFVKDMKVADEVDAPTGEAVEANEKKDEVINWLEVDHTRVSRDVLVAAAVGLDIDPPDKSNKAEILALIQAKLKE